MNKEKIIFWTATGIIFLFEGVFTGLTFQTEAAKQGRKSFGLSILF